MKYGLVFDSTCGLTKKEANERGLGFIPLVIEFNGSVKKAGVDIDTDFLVKNMTKEVVVKTSLPETRDVMAAFDEALKQNDEVIFIGMSKNVSGTYNSIKVLVDNDPKYNGKVHVYDSLWSSPWTSMYLEDIIEKNEKSVHYKELFSFLDKLQPELIGYLSPSSLYWFYKGGRISKSQYITGSLFKVIPILTIKDGKIDEGAVVKSFSVNKAMIKMVDLFKSKYKQLLDQGKKVLIGNLFAGDKALTDKFSKIIMDNLNCKLEDITTIQLSPEQTCHMGPGAFGLTYKIII